MVGGDGAVLWSEADVALLDEARELLGPRPGRPGGQAEAEIARWVRQPQGVFLQQLSEETLSQILRIVGLNAAAADVSIKRIPIGLAEMGQGLPGCV